MTMQTVEMKPELTHQERKAWIQEVKVKQELTQLGAWRQRVQHREQELVPGWLGDWQLGEGRLVKWKTLLSSLGGQLENYSKIL